MDAERLELMVEAFGKSVHGELRRAIRRHVESSDHARARGNVDDMAAAPGDHRRQDFVRTVDRAQIVCPHDFFDSLQRGLGERLVRSDAGVVDQYIDSTEVGENLCDHALHLLRIADIAADHG